MKAPYLKSLMIGAALCSFAGPGFAYTSTPTSNTTMVTSPSDYQTNSAAYPHENMGSLATQDTDTPAPRSASASTSSGMSSPGMSSGGISNPQQIGSCLCMQQSNQSLNGQVSAKQAAYDQAVAQRASLTSQLSQERSAASTPDQVNAIRATSEKLIMLQGQINDQYIPQLQAATSQYNGAVGQYSQNCAGKIFDANAEAQVQATLQCHG